MTPPSMRFSPLPLRCDGLRSLRPRFPVGILGHVRTITVMGDTDEILWVLADNTPAMVGKTELKEALRLAGQAQTAVWVKPYQPA